MVDRWHWWHSNIMMTSSNGNIFRVTGPLCGEFAGHRWIPRTQRPVTRSSDVFFDLCPNNNKQSWGWWFETLSRSLWRHSNVVKYVHGIIHGYTYHRLYCLLSVISMRRFVTLSFVKNFSRMFYTDFFLWNFELSPHIFHTKMHHHKNMVCWVPIIRNYNCICNKWCCWLQSRS